MHNIPITREEFEEFRSLQIRSRWDWPASFSCNRKKEVWPWIGYGFSDEKDRIHLQGEVPLLDLIVDIVLRERWLGGRFFINEKGVYLRPDDPHVLIAQFVFE